MKIKQITFLALFILFGTAVQGQIYESAFQEKTRLAKEGDAIAQYELSVMYKTGSDGAAVDDEKALYWLKESAKNGNSDAQYDLGGYYSYAFSSGSNMDIGKAFYWFKKSAEQGNSMAQYNVGRSYEYGNGTSENKEEAFYWYKKSAEQGYASAQNDMGDLYKNGEGTSVDNEQAVYWYTQSAEQDNSVAQYNLGLCYYYGNGVVEDKEQATKWLKKSMDNGLEKAKTFLSENNIMEVEETVYDVYYIDSKPKFKSCENVVDDPNTLLENEYLDCERESWSEQLKKFIIPEECEAGFKTRIIVTYSVNKEGYAYKIEAHSRTGDDELNDLFNEEMLRFFESLPAFIPAKRNGENVSVYGLTQAITIIK